MVPSTHMRACTKSTKKLISKDTLHNILLIVCLSVVFSFIKMLFVKTKKDNTIQFLNCLVSTRCINECLFLMPKRDDYVVPYFKKARLRIIICLSSGLYSLPRTLCLSCCWFTSSNLSRYSILSPVAICGHFWTVATHTSHLVQETTLNHF